MIICPSDFVLDSLIENGVKKDKIVMIPYGVDINYWGGSVRTYKKGSTLQLIFVGSGAVNKGLPVILDTMSELSGNNIVFYLPLALSLN